MKIALTMLLYLALGSVTLVGGMEYAVMTIKIKGFDEKKGVLIVESSPVCKKAKYAVFKDMNFMEMKKFAEEMEGKRVVVFIEKCEETLKVANFDRQGEKEVF